MKNTILLTTLITLSLTESYGQPVAPATNIPETINPLSPITSFPGLTDYSTTLKKNYIRMLAPDQKTTVWPPATGQGNYSRQVTKYFDGLGRPLQTVTKSAHFDGYDLIQQHVYDDQGREAFQYLPFSVPQAVSTGNFCSPVKTRLQSFYSGTPGEEPYGFTEYENSPLNRVLKQMSPGHSWVGSSRGTENSLSVNQAADNIRIWTIPPSGFPTSTAFYGQGHLSVTKTTDEDGKRLYEYKNQLGLIILKRAQLDPNSTSFYEGYACTYYVYDDLQRLRYVIPPEATNIARSVSWSLATATELCYSYKYNNKGLLTEKKVPGKGVENYFYDQRNREILYRDAKLAAQGKWMFNIYDSYDRPVVSGIYTTSLTETNFTAILFGPSSPPAGSIFSYMKNYNLWHTYPTSITDCQILGYTYYDNYVDGDIFSGFTFDASQLPALGMVYFLDYPELSKNAHGLVTGSKVRIMDPAAPAANNWIKTVNYYDEKARPIQTQTLNHVGGKDISSNVYYFQGMLRRNILRHENPLAVAQPGASDILSQIKLDKTYEHKIDNGSSGLLWRISQTINNGMPYDLSSYSYDHLGRITTKQFAASTVLQEYNLRGGLTHINVHNYNPNNSNPYIFEENLYYDKGFKSRLYNGNIAGITWSGSDATKKSYGYSYDGLNRLNHAEFRQQNADLDWLKNVKDYTASNITYDLNGNLQSMDQRGVDAAVNPSSPINMDQLTYSYEAGTNKLIRVSDGVSPSATPSLPDFKDNPALSNPIEYEYDINGNLKRDDNKKISAISYNLLNKPETITVSGEGTITYVYDATGNRIQKRVTDNASNTVIYDYLGNFVYKANQLQYILNEEGRCRPAVNDVGTTKFIYDYFVKDHLGNVRSTVTAEPISPQYLARHELSLANVEQLVFDNIPAVRDLKPGDPGTMAAHLVATDPDKRVGTAIMLKTMPGDKFTINADAYFEGEYSDEGTIDGGDVVSSLMSTLLGGNTYGGVPLSELPENVVTIQTALGNSNIVSQLDNLAVTNEDPSAPKAYLNYLFFNDEMQMIPEMSGKIQVQAAGGGWLAVAGNNTQICNCTISGPGGGGYLIVYIDNQSIGKDVWFDNVYVEHYEGNVIEENHYYPFGLTLAESSGALGLGNVYKYNGIGLNKDLKLEMYDAFYRDLDPQIGRFWQVDPKPTESISPYASMNNNPVLYTDYLGDTTLYYRDGDTKPFITINDNGAKVATIINKGSEGNVMRNYVLGIGGNTDNEMAASLNKYGTAYDLQSFEDFYDKNSKKFSATSIGGEDLGEHPDFAENGKQVKPYAEAGANLVMSHGKVTSGDKVGTSLSYNSVWELDIPAESGSLGPIIHLHPGPGKDFRVNFRDRFGGYQGATLFGGPSKADYSAHSKYNITVRSVMIDKANIYLFNRDKTQTIKIPR